MKREINWLIREKYNEKPGRNLARDISRLKKGEPVDYIIGFVDFLHCKIDLSCVPFIPRLETEFWAETAVKEIGDKQADCLDVFSGSGCIGTAILKNTKKTKVDFAEINKKFLKQIKLNLKINKIDPKRYRVFRSDIFQNVKRRYDYIFANPPYLSRKQMENPQSWQGAQKSVLDFEPHSALFGGEQGLDYIKRFLKNADSFLKKDGKIYLEFDSFQKKEIERILKIKGLNYCFYKDQYRKWRFLTASKEKKF